MVLRRSPLPEYYQFGARFVFAFGNKMAVINLTEDEEFQLYGGWACSPEITGGIHSQLICLSVLNSFMSVAAFLGNTLILVALHKQPSLHALCKLLFRTLATADLCVGFIVEPQTVIFWISAIYERWNICHYTHTAGFVTAYVLCSVSLLTLTTVSVDRLLALSLGLRYRQIVTLKRTYVTVTVFWILPIVFTLMSFVNEQIKLRYGTIVISVCLVTSVFSYVRIFVALRSNRTRVQQAQPSQTAALSMARYRKTVFSALWVQLALGVSYLPYGIVLVLNTQQKLTASFFLAWESTVTLLYLNSSLNPILYCWKIREVRQAVKETVRQLCCSSCS